jgi:hypothetical protein
MNILATTHCDSHGDKLALEALQQMCEMMNGERTVRMGLNHNQFLPPLGQYGKAYIVQDEKGEYLLCAEPILLDKYEEIDEQGELIHNYKEGLRGFREVDFDAPDCITVDIDFYNFTDFQAAEVYYRELNLEVDPNIEVNEKIRKELYPDPELVITLSKAFILYKFLKPIGEKVADKLSDKVSEDLAIGYEKIKKIITKTIKYFDKKYKKVVLIIEIPNSEIHIELATEISIENVDTFLGKLTAEEIDEIIEKSLKTKALFNGEKIQFVFGDDASWSFTYLLTKEGGVIGKRHLFEKRNRQYQVLLDRGQIFNSFGARVGRGE